MGSNPTLSAILKLLSRPDRAWREIHAAAPKWPRTLLAPVVPLALIPAFAGPASRFASTFVFGVAAVLIVAAAIRLLAPVFAAERSWERAVVVASYSSVPVFLASPLLASATLTILVLIAFFHGCFLCGVGLRRVLGCSGEDAPLYVAAVGFLSGIGGLVLGGLSSASGIL